MQVKNMRKEVADLLRTNKQENARIRVEAVIRENLMLQAYEVLELFLELLAVRVQLVEKCKDVPPDMIEALSSLVYAAQRVQVPHQNCFLLAIFRTWHAHEFCQSVPHIAHVRNGLSMEAVIMQLNACCVVTGLPGADRHQSTACWQVWERVCGRVKLRSHMPQVACQ